MTECCLLVSFRPRSYERLLNDVYHTSQFEESTCQVQLSHSKLDRLLNYCQYYPLKLELILIKVTEYFYLAHLQNQLDRVFITLEIFKQLLVKCSPLGLNSFFEVKLVAILTSLFNSKDLLYLQIAYTLFQTAIEENVWNHPQQILSLMDILLNQSTASMSDTSPEDAANIERIYLYMLLTSLPLLQQDFIIYYQIIPQIISILLNKLISKDNLQPISNFTSEELEDLINQSNPQSIKELPNTPDNKAIDGLDPNESNQLHTLTTKQTIWKIWQSLTQCNQSFFPLHSMLSIIIQTCSKQQISLQSILFYQSIHALIHHNIQSFSIQSLGIPLLEYLLTSYYQYFLLFDSMATNDLSMSFEYYSHLTNQGSEMFLNEQQIRYSHLIDGLDFLIVLLTNNDEMIFSKPLYSHEYISIVNLIRSFFTFICSYHILPSDQTYLMNLLSPFLSFDGHISSKAIQYILQSFQPASSPVSSNSTTSSAPVDSNDETPTVSSSNSSSQPMILLTRLIQLFIQYSIRCFPSFQSLFFFLLEDLMIGDKRLPHPLPSPLPQNTLLFTSLNDSILYFILNQLIETRNIPIHLFRDRSVLLAPHAFHCLLRRLDSFSQIVSISSSTSSNFSVLPNSSFDFMILIMMKCYQLLLLISQSVPQNPHFETSLPMTLSLESQLHHLLSLIYKTFITLTNQSPPPSNTMASNNLQVVNKLILLHVHLILSSPSEHLILWSLSIVNSLEKRIQEAALPWTFILRLYQLNITMAISKKIACYQLDQYVLSIQNQMNLCHVFSLNLFHCEDCLCGLVLCPHPFDLNATVPFNSEVNLPPFSMATIRELLTSRYPAYAEAVELTFVPFVWDNQPSDQANEDPLLDPINPSQQHPVNRILFQGEYNYENQLSPESKENNVYHSNDRQLIVRFNNYKNFRSDENVNMISHPHKRSHDWKRSYYSKKYEYENENNKFTTQELLNVLTT